MLTSIWLALAITFALAIAWLRINDFMAHRGWISGPVSRKIIHMGTGPIYVICWLLFPEVPYARYLASLVPGLITLQFLLVGTGIMKDQAAVDAMTRNGDRREILRGPLYYGIVFVILTLVYWRNSPIGIVALMLLCGGDGLADIVGKRFGTNRLPWSKKKSWAGSLSMFLGGWIFAMGVVWVYTLSGTFHRPFSAYFLPITFIAVVGAIVDAFPYTDVDNLTVPAVAVLLGSLMLPK